MRRLAKAIAAASLLVLSTAGLSVSVAAAEECPNEGIRVEQGSTALPHCRAYEMVSPHEKNLGEVIRVPAATDDGQAALLGATAAFEGSTGNYLADWSLATRGPGGWRLIPVGAPGHTAPFSGGPTALEPAQLSSGLSEVLLTGPAPLASADFGSSSDIYGVPLGTGSLKWYSEPQGVPLEASGFARFQGASADLSRAFFTTAGGAGEIRLPGAPVQALYEWSGGSLRVASILPDGTPSSGTVAINYGWRTSVRSPFSGATPDNMAVPHRGGHPISDDGSHVYWMPGTSGGALYLSIAGQPTRAVSASRRAGHEADPPEPAVMVGATHDGSVAFFVGGELTEDSTGGSNLYRYLAETDELELLTPAPVGSSGAGIDEAMMSDDGSHVYFAAHSALAPGAPEGERNLYVWGPSGIQYIATVDPPTGIQRVSGDGTQALFESTLSLEGAPNAGRQAIYAYDAASGDLACVSCRTDGSPSQGAATLGEEFVDGVFTEPFGNAPTQRLRNQTTDGRVFFMSFDRLLPADLNSVVDVYEYDNGHLALLSGGRSDYPSYLGDNGDSGDDVFILTRAVLVPSDDDRLYDLYDVRSGGGFPEPLAQTGLQCKEDECQNAASAVPPFSDPGSRAFVGKSKIRRRTRPELGPIRITASDRAKLAAGDVARLRTKVSSAGRIRVAGIAHVDGRSRRVMGGSMRARRAGRVTVPVSLTGTGLRTLRQAGVLRLDVIVRFGPAKPKKVAVTLRAAPGKEGGAR